MKASELHSIDGTVKAIQLAEWMEVDSLTNTATAGGFTAADLVDHLRVLKAKLADLPPPMELHVTLDLYRAMKTHWSLKPDTDLKQIHGVEVIASLPPDWPVQYEWRPRATRKKETAT